MKYSTFVLVVLSSFSVLSSAQHYANYFTDPKVFFVQNENLYDINPTTDDDHCENAVNTALQGNYFYSNSFLQEDVHCSTNGDCESNMNEIIWLDAAPVNGTTVKDSIVETSTKTADFLSNIAFAMDKAETYQEDKIDRNNDDLESMSRKMMAAKYLTKLNAHNFNAAITGTQTLASLTYTSFFSFGVS